MTGITDVNFFYVVEFVDSDKGQRFLQGNFLQIVPTWGTVSNWFPSGNTVSKDGYFRPLRHLDAQVFPHVSQHDLAHMMATSEPQ